MKKFFKLVCCTLLATLFISCGSSDESIVKKYLSGSYSREHKKESEVGFGYDKEITIQHLKGNEFRFTCIGNDRIYRNNDGSIKERIERTPDVFDYEISSITLKEKSDSVSKYYIKGFITNVVSDGTTHSHANYGVNHSGSVTLIVGKNSVEIMMPGSSLSTIRKK